MQGLDGPTAPDEFAGEPVEQFRMTGKRADPSEVGGGSYEAASEMVMPDAVDHHSGGQGFSGLAIQSAKAFRRPEVVRIPSGDGGCRPDHHRPRG